ncbi:MAG: helix-turn-helix domain-containing protein [Phenylobacterium sp.]|uniref:helix-turn-helix domain-containing protein n=1 Tax=Phenylobacterium sp. TaxID=1871053 RepID=UPI00391C085C
MRTDATPKKAEPMDLALGTTIRLRRRSLDMSQSELAELCGVTFQQIQKYENGSNRISFSRLVKIADALRCRVTDLVGPLDNLDVHSEAGLEMLNRAARPDAQNLLTYFSELDPATREQLIRFLETLAAAEEVPMRRRA